MRGGNYRHNYGQRSSDSKGNMISFFVAEANVNCHADSNVWIFDTAATHHFCKNRDLFVNFKSIKNENMILAVNGIEFPIEGKGDIYINFGFIDCMLKDVLYSHKLRRNLISGPKLDQNGFCFSGKNGVIKALAGENTIFNAKLEMGLYYVYPVCTNDSNREGNNKSVNFVSNVESKETCDKLSLWHERFAHANIDYIIRTSQLGAVKGLPSLKKPANFSCEPCKLNKHRRVSFHAIEEIRSKQPLELLYLDTWGPINVLGKKGERYYLSVTDDYSRRMWVYPMCDKSDAFDIFVRHVNRAETSINLRVKAIRSDNGLEFANHNFVDFCSEKGIKPERTNIYTPMQNGVAERLNRTVLDGARTILYKSGLSKSFWPEAILSFVHVWNRLCHNGQSKTPIELYTGSKPSVKHLQSFGSTVYVGTPKQLRGKLDPKARKGIMVGYALSTKGYRVWIPELEKVIETCNVSFPRSDHGNVEQSSGGAVLAPEFQTYDWVSQGETNDLGRDEHEMHLPISSPQRQTSGPVPRSPIIDTDEDDSDRDDEDGGAAPARTPLETTWTRKVVTRPDKSRNDIYYYDDNRKGRMRSIIDVEKHCKAANLKFDPSLFDFSGSNLYQGPVNPQPSTSGIQNRKAKS